MKQDRISHGLGKYGMWQRRSLSPGSWWAGPSAWLAPPPIESSMLTLPRLLTNWSYCSPADTHGPFLHRLLFPVWDPLSPWVKLYPCEPWGMSSGKAPQSTKPKLTPISPNWPHLRSAPVLGHWSHSDLYHWLWFCKDVKQQPQHHPQDQTPESASSQSTGSGSQPSSGSSSESGTIFCKDLLTKGWLIQFTLIFKPIPLWKESAVVA